MPPPFLYTLQFSKMSSIEVSKKTVAGAAARRLVRLALDGGSIDDISVIVNLYDWIPAAAAGAGGGGGDAAITEVEAKSK